MIVTVTELVHRTRQHHAIEHATLHVLSMRHPGRSFSGYSDPLGFTIVGELDEDSLRHAVGDALMRLQAGEHRLARHPNCGTNLVTSAVLIALVALVTTNRRSLLERFVMTLISVVPVMVVARPIGLYLQGYTTSADVGDRWVAEIRPIAIGSLHAHRVLFE